MSSSFLETMPEREGTGRLQMWGRARRRGWRADRGGRVMMNNS